MAHYENRIKKMLPKVRIVINNCNLFPQNQIEQIMCIDFFLSASFYPFILKAYLREYVSHEICLALTHFKNLEPIMDTYGMEQK